MRTRSLQPFSQLQLDVRWVTAALPAFGQTHGLMGAASRTSDLFRTVAPHARKVMAALANGTWIRDIVGSLMIPVLSQYLLLRQQLDGFVLRPEVEDQVKWRWSASGTY
jgi:hypothetical protein